DGDRSTLLSADLAVEHATRMGEFPSCQRAGWPAARRRHSLAWSPGLCWCAVLADAGVLVCGMGRCHDRSSPLEGNQLRHAVSLVDVGADVLLLPALQPENSGRTELARD